MGTAGFAARTFIEIMELRAIFLLLGRPVDGDQMCDPYFVRLHQITLDLPGWRANYDAQVKDTYRSLLASRVCADRYLIMHDALCPVQLLLVTQ